MVLYAPNTAGSLTLNLSSVYKNTHLKMSCFYEIDKIKCFLCCNSFRKLIVLICFWSLNLEHSFLSHHTAVMVGDGVYKLGFGSFDPSSTLGECKYLFSIFVGTLINKQAIVTNWQSHGSLPELINLECDIVLKYLKIQKVSYKVTWVMSEMFVAPKTTLIQQ